MSSRKKDSVLPIEMEISLRDQLISICRLFDENDESFRFYYYYKEFCEVLYKCQENNDDKFDENSTMDQLVQAALEVKNFEYKTKLLKVLMVYWNKEKVFNKEKYERIKNEILSLLPTYTSESIFNMSEDYITSECDRAYFELCFLLKQNQLKKFEFEFETLVERFKRFYGDYWKYSMKKDCGRFLKEIAENRRYYKTIEFMLHKCPFIELDSTIVTEFKEIDDLMFVYGGQITDEDRMFIDQWRSAIQDFEAPDDETEERDFREIFEKNFPEDEVTRKRLFGRTSEIETSLLEEMLLCSSSSFIFECAWNRFRLWTLPEIFSYKNPSGKALIDYVIESGNEEQIQSYMMPKNAGSEDSFDKRKHFLVMKNNQFYSRTEKCIVEHLMENLVGDDEDGSLFPHFVYLLEEIGIRKNLEKDSLVEKLIYFSKCDDLYEQVTGMFLDEKNEMAKKYFFIEDILGNMMVYWRGESEHYLEYKRELEQVSPFYKLMFLLIEKDKKFCDDFKENMTKLEESFTTRYNEPEESEAHSSNMLFIMLLAAIKTKQRDLIDFIFNNDTFQTIHFEFPDNIVPQEIHYYTALKFLKYKHGIGQSKIPREWLTFEVLEDFFDSQIRFSNQELIEIDCTSLLHPESQKKVVDMESALSDEKIMRDDVESLEYITNQENLKELIVHPVIETYINLKSLKYQRIFTWNFWAFVIFFITPFVMLIMYNAFHDSTFIQHKEICWYTNTSTNENSPEVKENNTSSYEKNCAPKIIAIISIGFMKFSHIIAIIFLFLREGFQCILSDEWIKYFKKSSNLFEITLFILSVSLSIATLLQAEEYIKHLEVVFILFTTISATSILPFAHVPINMQILRKVALTFLRIFYTFAIILIAFSFSFCIMFFKDDKDEGKGTKVTCCNCTKDDDDDDDPTNNFKYPHTALVKIVTMLSGEYEIQPFKLETTQLLFFSFFIISSFILFNLILGLSIEDVQELKKSSRAFDLKTKSERFIEVSKKVEDHLEKYNEETEYNSNAKFWKPLSFKLIRFFLTKYLYLHNITKIYLNIKTKQVFVKVAHKHQPILTKKRSAVERTFNVWKRLRSLWFIKSLEEEEEEYKISKETFKDIQDIITNKNRKMFKHLKKKLEEEKQED